MEITINILLPTTTDISHLKLKKDFYEWDGTSYPQGLAKRIFKENWIIEGTPIPQYIANQFANIMQTLSWRCLAIRGIGLDELVLSMINPDAFENHDDTLIDIFKQTIFLSPKWITIFEINNNPITDTYLDTPSTLVKCLADRIKKKNSFVSYDL